MTDPTSIVARARSLRRDMTDVERRLWSGLRNRRLGGHKFVRQMPVGPFFADFCCREARLIVELDGSQHAGSAYDEQRDRHLIDRGFRVLRFWNQDVVSDIGAVCDTSVAAIDGRLEPYDRYTVR